MVAKKVQKVLLPKVKEINKNINKIAEKLPDIDKITTPEIEKIKFSEKHKKFFTAIHDILFEKPLLKFIILLLVVFMLNVVGQVFPRSAEWAGYVFFILIILLLIYFVVLIISMVRHSFKRLLNAPNMLVLVSSYLFFVIGIVLLLSLAFNAVEISGHGYLTYGECSDTFDKTHIIEDNQVSHQYFYFAAITFFTVGYGDICPMGWAKGLSLATAFIGHFVSVVIMFIVLNYYLQRKTTEKENGKENGKN